MRAILSGLPVLLLLQGAALAQVTEAEQRQLCGPDVMRLCLSAVPDRTRIVACMRANREQLSPGCLSVFERKRTNAAALN